MQACVYAAPCMLLSSDLVDAPCLLLSVSALFFGLSSRCCTALNIDSQHVLSRFPQNKLQSHSHHFCHYYGDLTVSLSSASLTTESLNHYLILDSVDLKYGIFLKTGWL